MDQKIYYPTQSDYGIFSVRRLPKGRNYPISAPQGPTDPTDPNSNPLPVTLHFSGSAIAPHSTTKRFTYTVPPKRRARLESALVHFDRSTAAAPAGRAGAFIRIERVAAQLTQEIMRRNAIDNGTGSYVGNHSGPIELFEGDRIFGSTLDGSTGGTINFNVSCALIEYDATHRVIGQESSGFIGEGTRGNGNGGTGGLIRGYYYPKQNGLGGFWGA